MDLTFSFNGINSSDFGILWSPNVPLLPPKRQNTIEIPGMDGVLDFGENSYSPLVVSGDAYIRSSSRAAREAALASAAAWLSGAGPLILGRDTTKRWPMAKVYDQIDPRNVGHAGFFPLSFECNPPYLEDVNVTTGTIGTAQNYGSPVEFYPVITVTKTGTTAASLQVSLQSTGEFVKVTDTIASGDVLVFDMSVGKVTKNGVSCMSKVSIDSLIFGVPPGSQTISVTTTSTFTASISYRRRYLYA